ncbi:hypothetical protein ACFFWC_26985 [Plantactinospora siamensis]|uniref:Uncharacterized protein n=1 Tax=Plantactinospora siamensis TaxID=555372 RepID=A0ABV6NYY6_9ACTN
MSSRTVPALPRPTPWRRRWSGWPRWSGAVVVAVLSGYGVAAAVWFLGGPYAFARPDNPESTFPEHWLASLRPAAVEAATLALAGLAVAAVLLMRRRIGGPLRPALLVVGFGVAVLLALVLPGPQALDGIPVLNLANLKRLAWPTVHLVLLEYTGLALGAATLAYARATRGACEHCGRGRAGTSSGGRAAAGSGGRAASWPRGRAGTWSRARWARIGTVSAVAAFLAPFGYAVVRLCWAAGIPVGTTKDFLRQINAANPGHGTLLLELILSGLAIGGGLLCLGLTRPWSETWPRWVPGLAGRPVPHWLPVGLATVCGIGLFGFATTLVPDLLRFAAGRRVYYPGTAVRTTWLSHLPAISLLLWGALVLVSAAAFHYRTRPHCVHCGRDDR